MSSASPDELALVQGAQQLGFSFEGKSAAGVISVKRRVDDECLQFQLLSTLEFTSKRKRMSVIVRDLQTGKIRLICKGADSVVK